MNITRLFDILELYKYSYADKEDVFSKNENDKWIKYSGKEYLENVNNVSYGLLELGVKPGDNIATISANRPEWNFIDMGMAQIGAVHVPIYPTLSAEDQEYILNHCEAKFLFVSDNPLLQKVKPVLDRIKTLEGIYTFNKIEGENYWMDLVELGKKNCDKYKDELDERKKSISKDDLATLIYTSGTTGNPKGVMLSHNNILSNAIASSEILPLDHTKRVLCFLPLCHVYERMMIYTYQINGVSVYYIENLARIGEFIKQIKPHAFNTVPRLLERVYDSIITKGKDLPGIKKKIFFWAVNLAKKYDLNKGLIYRKKLAIADKLIFSKWRAGLGGNIQLMVSGGSALQVRLIRIFWAAGLPVYEGYGLSESSPVIAVNDPRSKDTVKFGTVGPILKDVEVKIAKDGEILCKGPNVMMGYYKDEKQTKETIKDGWLHTGDIGILVDNKFLKITDRKKEMFKTSAGKYIAPQVIENILKESNTIEQAMVIGENQKFASALISPNFNDLHYFASKNKLHFRDNEDLIKLPEIIKKVQQEVNLANKRLGQTEQIKRIRLVCKEWSPATGELSPTLKLKRKVLNDQYKHIIDEIYSVEQSS